jgi:putative heme-binding domain-containing protein
LPEIEQSLLRRLPTGDARLGRDVFERLGCVACHDVAGEAKLFGPSLKGIGQAATPTYVAESILYPSRVVKDGFENELVRLKNGETFQGWIEQHGQDLVVVRGGLDRVPVAGADVAERRKLEQSPMPEFSLDGVSIGELVDLLAYLVSQGGDPKAAQARK